MSARTPYMQLYADAARQAIPLDIMVELTHRCTFRCRHCYIPDFHAPELLTTSRVLRLLDELAEMGTLRLALSGGELFLRPDWLAIATRARRLGFELRLFSNGSTVTGPIADAIAPLHAAVEVSLYSLDRETFERVMRTPGSFDRTMRGIELLRERDIPVLLKATMTIHTHARVADVHAFAASIGADCISSPGIMPRKDGTTGPLSQRVPEALLLPYYAGPFAGSTVPTECVPDRRDDGPLCAAASRSANITAAGDVLPCVILPMPAGNICQQSFREIWEDSPVMRRIRAIRRRDLIACDTCSKLAYCARCHAQALVEDGDLYGLSTWACEHAGVLEEVARRRKA